MRTLRRLARKRRLAAFLKRRISHSSVLKAFTMRLPVTVSCRMFWISASLSWPVRVRVRTSLPILREEVITTGTNSSSAQLSCPPSLMTKTPVRPEGEELLQKFAEHRADRVLHRSTSLMSVERMVPVACL
jgi:hypothetical protein